MESPSACRPFPKPTKATLSRREIRRLALRLETSRGTLAGWEGRVWTGKRVQGPAPDAAHP